MTKRAMSKEGQPKSAWKEATGKIAIAGGIVAGALGLLAQSSGAFVLGILGIAGGYYVKVKA